MNKIVHLAKKNFRRVIGSGELFAIGYGDVGSSIYYTLGATALYALGATPIALLLAGIAFICTALTYAELASTYPESGGSATYTRYAFNDLVSFIAGWGLLLDYVLTLAISVFTIPPYLKHIFRLFGWEAYLSGEMHFAAVVVIIAFLFIINFIGVRSSTRISLLLAIFTLVTQAGIVLMGTLLVLNIPYVIEHMSINVPGANWSPDWMQFLKGLAMAMVAYTGIEAISQLARETKNPGVSIPRAIKWTVACVIFLYVGLSFVGLSIVSPHELGTKYIDDAISGIAVNFPVGGEILGPWVGLTAAIILLICANAGLIGCSRLIFTMSSFYQVPKIFYKLHPRFRTPHTALLVFCLIAILVVLWSRNQMLLLADLYNFGAQIAFFSAHASLIVLRWKNPSIARPYKAPFNIPLGKNRSVPLTAVFGFLVSFAVWLLVIVTKPEGRVAGLCWMGIGLLIYAIYRRKEKLSIAGSIEFEEIKIPEYKHMKVKDVLVTVGAKGNVDALQMAMEIAQFHKAKITALHVVEIPDSVPFNIELVDLELAGQVALKRAQAIAREFHKEIHLLLVRARSLEEALFDLTKTKDYDLVVVGLDKKDFIRSGGLSSQAKKFLSQAPCRVVFCKS